MAHCFRCGTYMAPTATHFRRKVKTGSSSGGWVSARSAGSSSRSYYGMRSLCAACADAHDRTLQLKVWIVIAVVALLVMMAVLQPQPSRRSAPLQSATMRTSGTIRTGVAANIRQGPSSDSSVIATSKPGDKFVIVSTDGNWYRVARPESASSPIGYVHRSVVEASR